ncbi:MAG TPA: ribosome silencing factor [Bacteroidia bacterium]|nr:ribosome silencing factor [Bacteroidia bacterium]
MGKVNRLRKEQVKVEGIEFLIEAIVKGIEEKKGHDITVMDLKTSGSAPADFFVVCHGDSQTQVVAIARSIEEEVEKITGEAPTYKEGYTNAEWVLLDYINVVVHVFLKEQRDFYGIERFWADDEIRKIK